MFPNPHSQIENHVEDEKLLDSKSKALSIFLQQSSSMCSHGSFGRRHKHPLRAINTKMGVFKEGIGCA